MSSTNTHPTNRSRRWPLVVAAAVLVAALVAGGWWLGARGAKDTPPPAPSAAGSSSSSSPAPPAPTGDGKCNLPKGEATPPNDPPKAKWEIVNHVTVPVSPDYGPALVEGNDRSCYAHNPTGALFATVNFAALPVHELLQHVTSGPLRDDLVKNGNGTVKSSLRVAGYSIEEATEDGVKTTVVYRQDNGALLASPVRLVWQDGDWMVDGSFFGQVTRPASLEGYVEWSPS